MSENLYVVDVTLEDLGADNDSEKGVYDYLKMLEIPFILYRHEESPTTDHVAKLDQNIRGRHCKNLFLRNSVGDKLFMLIAPYDKAIDTKIVARTIGSTRLSFADPEKMRYYLQLEPGSVSPFGLINDAENVISVLLDQDICSYEFINFHPNVNTATLSLAFTDFEKYLNHVGNSWQALEIPSRV